MAKETTSTSSKKSGTIVRGCPSCKPHEFQDTKYGKNQRVMNLAKGGDVGRCTVCLTETKLR